MMCLSSRSRVECMICLRDFSLMDFPATLHRTECMTCPGNLPLTDFAATLLHVDCMTCLQNWPLADLAATLVLVFSVFACLEASWDGLQTQLLRMLLNTLDNFHDDPT